MAKLSPLAERLDAVREKIAAAALRSRRAASDVTLVAVTKHAPPEAVREIVQLGVTDLGEGRAQQLVQRASQMNEFHARRAASEGETPKPLRWHMVGHLQRNKVKPLLPVVGMVHSVDSLRLAEEIDTLAAKIERKIPVMVQVNASEEPQKHGVAVGAATHLAEQIATMPNVQVVGLMSMAAHGSTPEQTRHVFARTREIYEEMKWLKIGGPWLRYLSMGMSDDYEIAVEEGATMVRVGTALFGEKPADAPEDD